ncbi:uncharacterized protein LOC111072212 [Drosophila obscura]|uniref:uncharacterized protein LOC111072212 n=1 Tax=Drosophila obscura TaxID=7282 RepID=UPI001BB11B90|nr:uncharacterized protein LOC111072212 [Drosophila obscura]
MSAPPLKMSRGATARRLCSTDSRCMSRNFSLDSGFGTEVEDSRQELSGSVVEWPPSSMAQGRHQMTKLWPRQVIQGELLAESKRHPRKPQMPVTSYQSWHDVPLQWVEISGFPCGATEQILNSFHCVGTILKKRHTPHSLQLQYAFTVEAYRALEFDSVCICGYKVRVQGLLEDPEEQQRAQLTSRVPQYPCYYRNPQHPKFGVRQWQCCHRQRQRQRQQQWNCSLTNDTYQECWFWGFVVYCCMVWMDLLFYCMGCLWRSFDKLMKSRNANGNDTHPGAGYHCELVNDSVNRHLKAATKATHYRQCRSN